MSLLRTRWAAVGAAVAVTLGAGGIGLVSATTPSNATTFVAITPCRVMDTRPGPTLNVGPKASPVGPGEEHSVTAIGATGNCTEVPASAAAVSLNVTAVNASQSTFLTIYASDATRPVASSLNPEPGDPPTPNAVTTELSPGGEFTIFNRFGNVDVLADVNGYYVDHQHDDRYYAKDESDVRYATHWLIVSAQGTIRSASPSLADTLIFRPPTEPEGVYCLVFPSALNVERGSIQGTIEYNITGTHDWGIAVQTTVNTGKCTSSGQPWNAEVFTTRTTLNGSSLLREHDNAGFRLTMTSRR